MAIGKKGMFPGYPKYIRDTWIGLPDDIDAALTVTSNNSKRAEITYFFKVDGAMLNRLQITDMLIHVNIYILPYQVELARIDIPTHTYTYIHIYTYTYIYIILHSSLFYIEFGSYLVCKV